MADTTTTNAITVHTRLREVSSMRSFLSGANRYEGGDSKVWPAVALSSRTRDASIRLRCSLAAATPHGKRRRAPHSKASLRAADGLWLRGGGTMVRCVAFFLAGGCRTDCLTWAGNWLFSAAAAALECGALHRFPIPSRTPLVGVVLRRQQACSPPVVPPLAFTTDQFACEWRADSG
jgi:hypothetical protein